MNFERRFIIRVRGGLGGVQFSGRQVAPGDEILQVAPNTGSGRKT